MIKALLIYIKNTIARDKMKKQEYIYKGVVKKVLDGDTYDILFDLGFHNYWQTRVRLYGVQVSVGFHSRMVSLTECLNKAGSNRNGTRFRTRTQIHAQSVNESYRYPSVTLP